MDPIATLALIGIGICIAAVFLLSLAEAALVATPEISTRRLADQGDRRAIVLQRLLETGDYLSVVILGVNAGVLGAATATTLLVRHLAAGEPGWQHELWHAAVVGVILVFAELTPKTYGTLFAARVSLAVAKPTWLLTRALGPAVRLLNAMSRAALGAGGLKVERRRHYITPSEIQAAADVGEEEGVVEREEGAMLDSVIELGETTAHEIMTPRVDVVAVPETANLDEVVAVALESGFSRIPTYSGSLDSITGIAYVNDLLYHLRSDRAAVTLKDIVREPFFVPETIRLDDLFRELRERTVHIAIVVDEFGGTEGVVSVEDILEELVGEIADEHDREDEDILPVSAVEALVDAKARIGDVNDALGTSLPEDEYSTVGGLVTGTLGRIPEEGERAEVGGVSLVVEESDEQHVSRIRIIITNTEGGEG
jgi:CBS domain containing-hemolysin-like protein